MLASRVRCYPMFHVVLAYCCPCGCCHASYAFPLSCCACYVVSPLVSFLFFLLYVDTINNMVVSCFFFRLSRRDFSTTLPRCPSPATTRPSRTSTRCTFTQAAFCISRRCAGVFVVAVSLFLVVILVVALSLLLLVFYILVFVAAVWRTDGCMICLRLYCTMCIVFFSCGLSFVLWHDLSNRIFLRFVLHHTSLLFSLHRSSSKILRLFSVRYPNFVLNTGYLGSSRLFNCILLAYT